MSAADAALAPAEGAAPAERVRRGEIHRLDTSEREAAYLLQCDNGATVRLSETAKLVLELSWAGHGFEEIAAELQRRRLRPADAAQVERYCAELTRKLDHIEETLGGPTDPGFGFTKTIFSAETAMRIASRLTWMYSPFAAAVSLVWIAVAWGAWWFAADTLRRPHLEPVNLALGYALYFGSLFVHEFGHSAACMRYGRTAGRIGLTVYIVLPALFSDVGVAWKLKRWQRVVVDAGGSYFHALAGALFVTLGFATGWAPFFLATLLIGFTLIFNMNPIFKFDGYWLVADALGVTNLSKQPAKLFGYAVDRMRGRAPHPLPWNAATVTLLAVYSGAAIVVWAWFLCRLAWSLGRQGVSLVTLALGAVHRGHAGPMELFQLWLALTGVIFTVYYATRLFRRGVTLVRGLHARTADDRG
ncbi:MAG TPA: M50 family metallopeptidase [Candidatus Elarobacter sp.]|nr:M50 family metallopeptidase [Candidatus Elarobacter sp.]